MVRVSDAFEFACPSAQVMVTWQDTTAVLVRGEHVINAASVVSTCCKRAAHCCKS